jgi:hypothetical protein
LKPHKEKQIIGRREKIDFPELGLFGIEAKVDTGAYTTALHCYDIKVVNDHLYFKPLSPDAVNNGKEVIFKEFFKKEIKNSFGDVEERYIIRTKVKIGKRIIKSLISLTDRGGMRYPVLLGRKLLKNRFVVDVSQINLTESIKK